MTIVPHQQLDPQTLEKLIEEFVTRDGAIHGHHESSTPQRVDAILRQLKSREVVIVFDDETESCTIISAKDAPKE